jgi:hypothetical protein
VGKGSWGASDPVVTANAKFGIASMQTDALAKSRTLNPERIAHPTNCQNTRPLSAKRVNFFGVVCAQLKL